VEPAQVDVSRRPRTPQSLAAALGWRSLPLFLALGFLLGVVARGWMRLISSDPEFTMAGTAGIVVGFAIFSALQSVSALAAARRWRDWPRRGARLLGAAGLLPLFVAQGAVMAPFVIFAGLAVWHPDWPKAVRWGLAVLALADATAVAMTITSDFGASIQSAAGVCGLVIVYGCVVWVAGGTFSPPRAATAAPAVPRPAVDR
jgi:hypothetical protein